MFGHEVCVCGITIDRPINVAANKDFVRLLKKLFLSFSHVITHRTNELVS